MATVTSLTAARMQEIEAASVVDGEVVGGNLILTRHDGTPIDAGRVVGLQGPEGPSGIGIPGEIKLWPGANLPDETAYGLWTWANGGIFDISAYPIAAANIDPAWKTAMGLPNPGAGKFRVPDLRGLVPAGLDAMPIGSARAGRLTRAVAIMIATKTGEETHIISIPEMPSHAHPPQAQSFAITQSLAQAGGGTSFAAINAAVNATGNTGGGGAHENMQPTVFVPYICKLDG